MIDFILDTVSNPKTLFSIFISVTVIATILAVAMPFLDTDNLAKRMKSVAAEREVIRVRNRDKSLMRAGGSNLRAEPKAFMKQVVEKFSLKSWLNTETAKAQLMMAGFRGPQAEIGFLFFRLVTPLSCFFFSLFYMYVLIDLGWNFAYKLIIALGMGFIGVKGPEIFMTNVIKKRQLSLRRAFPDAMDLILICVESGMAIEPAFQKVGNEIGVQSVELAEEFALTTAELSYLPDRRSAYENMALRTGTDGMKQISTVLIQAEKYGTPLAKALRVVSQESRDMRMADAERKAASLPPKLTVPMIVFFLPVIFVVIMTPAAIQVSATSL